MKPKTIKVVGKIYQIVYGEFQNRGLCEAVKQKISIDHDLPPDEERDTILHEVFHAIEDAMGIDMADRNIRCLATGMYAVFRDNPDFFRYIGERIGKP